MNKVTDEICSIASTNLRLRYIILRTMNYSLRYPFGNFTLSILDYVSNECSHKKVSASLQTCAWKRFTTRYIKRSIYRRHVVRYKFSLFRVLSNELVVTAKLKQKLRFVVGEKRLNSQILPRDFPRKMRIGEKERKSSMKSWKYLCWKYLCCFFFFLASKIQMVSLVSI